MASPDREDGARLLGLAHRSGAEDSGGAGDGQGQAQHRVRHDHVEHPIETDRHRFSPCLWGPADPGPRPIWTVIR